MPNLPKKTLVFALAILAGLVYVYYAQHYVSLNKRAMDDAVQFFATVNARDIKSIRISEEHNGILGGLVKDITETSSVVSFTQVMRQLTPCQLNHPDVASSYYMEVRLRTGIAREYLLQVNNGNADDAFLLVVNRNGGTEIFGCARGSLLREWMKMQGLI